MRPATSTATAMRPISGNVTTSGNFDGITGAIWTDSFGDGYAVRHSTGR